MTATLDPFALAADVVDPPPNPYLRDPVGWVQARTGEHLWSKQVEIGEALVDHRKVAVKACHGPGKSFSAARLVAWWLDTHPPGEAFVVTSAPTWKQVKAVLWREIRKAHKAADKRGTPLPGRTNLDCEWFLGDELVAFGRKPADHDDSGFQGIHARYVLVVLDEACGIPPALWTAADTLLTNDDARILAIGNPDDPLSEFAEVCEGSPDPLDDGTTPSGRSKHGWWVITISTFDTPNFTGEAVPDDLRHLLPSHTWLEDVERKWGRESPLYTSKVLGRFPPDAADGVVPWSWLQKCRGDLATERIGGLRVPVELGVDVGGSDQGDETVIACRQGMQLLERTADAERASPWRLRTGDSEVIVDRVLDAVRETGATSVKVDVIGVGFGVFGSLRRRAQAEVPWPVKVHGVNVGEAASQPDRFVNLRAELWWELGRELSRTGSWDLSGASDDVLLELAAPRYREVNRRVQIESKDEVRKRIGRSTDNADAVLLAFYQPPQVERVTRAKPRDRRLRGRR